MHAPKQVMALEREGKRCGSCKSVVSGGSLPPVMFQQVSLSASKDGERARETHLGGALRCVRFFYLSPSYMI